MVNNMNALRKLWLTKGKGTIRNLFSKPSSAIFTLLIISFYSGLFALLMTIDEGNSLLRYNVHLSIMYAIGFCALMIFILMMQKKKALFFENDSFYLFCGPFTKEDIMHYLSLQSIGQSMLFGALSVFIMVCYSVGTCFSLITYIMIFIVCTLLVYFFLLLCDYLYILSITNEKYKRLSFIIATVLLLSMACVFIYALIDNKMNVSSALVTFVMGDLFYFVPVFGWTKLILISFVYKEYGKMIIGGILLCLAIIILRTFFIHFKGDFYEKAMEDSVSYTAFYKSVREGKREVVKEAKVKDIKATFKSGAWSIYSKNIITMKKTKDLISGKDVFVILLYLAISYFSDLGYGFFMYMLMIYVFSALEESYLLRELENYQIYLIPDKPFKKLIALILPNLLRMSVICTVSMVLAGVAFNASLVEIILNTLSIYGYLCVFTSASILSIRILKSRTNKMMTNIVRMFLLFICVLPALLITLGLYIIASDTQTILYVVTYVPLILNFVISFLILYLCKNMMNGREIKED